MRKRPAGTKEICDALRAGGYLTNSASFYQNVFSGLRRRQDFVSVQRKWGLAEWYPGRRLDQTKSKVNGKEGASVLTKEAEPEEEEVTA